MVLNCLFVHELRSIATNGSMCNFLMQQQLPTPVHVQLKTFDVLEEYDRKKSKQRVARVTSVDPHPGREGYLLPARFTPCHLRRTSEWTDRRASHAQTHAHGAP